MATWFEITYTGEPTEADFKRVAELAAQGYTSGQLINEEDYDYDFDTLENLPEPSQVKTAGEARDIAQQWQRWAGDASLSYGELAAWAAWFREVATRFNLTEEFNEEGII